MVTRLKYRISVGLLLVLASGCSSARVGGDESPDDVLHDLRRDRAALAQRLDQLEQDIARRLEQIDQLEREQAAGPVDGVNPVDLPRFVELKVGRFSGPLDTNDDGRDDVVRLYLETLDQHGRFLPVAGRGTAQVVILSVDQPPTVAGEMTVEPKTFDASYRSGLMGTHYRIDIPVEAPGERGLHTAAVKMAVMDAATGAVVECDASMRLRVVE